MSNKDHKQTDEQQVRELYQALPKVEPPPLLDEKIIAAAHAELEHEDIKKTSGLRSWYVPLSMAAVIMISFSLVLKLVIDEQAVQPKSDVGLPFEMEREFSRETQDETLQEEDPESSPVLAPQLQQSAPAPAARQSLQEMTGQVLEKELVPTKKAASSAGKGSGKGMDSGKVLDSSKDMYSTLSDSPRQAPALSVDMAVEGKYRSDGSQQELRLKGDTENDPREILVSRMKEMLDQGQYEKLQEELRSFRSLYPDYELPEVLAAWENRGRPSFTE
jgi:hypothetical protein